MDLKGTLKVPLKGTFKRRGWAHPRNDRLGQGEIMVGRLQKRRKPPCSTGGLVTFWSSIALRVLVAFSFLTFLPFVAFFALAGDLSVSGILAFAFSLVLAFHLPFLLSFFLSFVLSLSRSLNVFTSPCRRWRLLMWVCTNRSCV